jgi:broad specificity phosphatase PhoE
LFFFVPSARRNVTLCRRAAERALQQTVASPDHVRSFLALSRVLHLARHATHAEVGRTLSGRSEIPLSDAGQAEAEVLALCLECVPIGRIVASPRRRAIETAQIVASRIGVPIEIAEDLDEIDFGEWTGRSFEALERDARWHLWNAHRGIGAAPGGEAMVDAVARARGFIDRLPDGDVLCVSHCDIIRGIVADILGLHLDRLLAFDCDPASLTTLALWPGGGRLVSLNQVSPKPAHLSR